VFHIDLLAQPWLFLRRANGLLDLRITRNEYRSGHASLICASGWMVPVNDPAEVPDWWAWKWVICPLIR